MTAQGPGGGSEAPGGGEEAPGTGPEAPAGGPRYGSRHCIICGRDNPAGARAAFRPAPGGAEAEVTPPAHLQGFAGVLHGGIVTGLLDDAMWYAAHFQGLFTMTAEITVRFRKPVPTGRPLRLAGRLVARKRRLAEMAAELADAESGEILAEASGKFLEVSEAMRRELGGDGLITVY